MGAHLDEPDRVTVLDRSKSTRSLVEQRLRALISSDELDGDGRLPTERELAGMYGVSRTTVRQVLDGLEHAGLIRRRRGRTGGTFVTRGRLADEVRISLEHARFPVAMFPDLLGERLDDSIYELMAHRYGLRAVKAVERLVAVLADADQAALLGIEAGHPLMAIERVAYDPADQPLEYATDLVQGD